ncbi:MAG: TetR/AcrR family transcriptional regulator [Actinomycetota bacterium]|nr:TetR/AcrR family transcriptional regulator [Actinomycetota bacterium]
MTGAERREQLIGVARALFAEKGYSAASIEEIAVRANVSKPVVYEHFGGKDGLYSVIIEREVGDLIERIAEALQAPHPREAVEQAAEAFLRYIEEERDGFRVLVRDAPVIGGTGSLSAVIAGIAAQVEGLLAREFGARGYDRKIAPVMARALVGMVALTGEWWLDVGKPSRKVVAAHLVNLAWNGLKDLDRDSMHRVKRSTS